MIQLIKLNTGSDAALIVNGQIVASVDTSFEEDGSIGNLETIAERLAGALDNGLQVLDAYPVPNMDDWSWEDVISSMAVASETPATNSKKPPASAGMGM